MTYPLTPPLRNDREMIKELEDRERLGIQDDIERDDLSEVTVPEPGQRHEDARKQKSVRMGKRWSQIVQSVQDGEYTWEQFAAALHPRELARGQLFDSRGGFSGRPPKLVPRAFHDACVRELMKRGKQMYQENYLEAIKAMTVIASDESQKASDRLKAAQFVIERLEGKVPERVEVSQAPMWQDMIAGITAEVAEEKAMANAHDYLARTEGEVDHGGS